MRQGRFPDRSGGSARNLRNAEGVQELSLGAGRIYREAV
jgi:hypothetical protein